MSDAREAWLRQAEQLALFAKFSVHQLIAYTHDAPFRKQAEESLDALLAHLRTVPAGYALVPVEPTAEMLDAMQSSGWMPGNYRAMIAAAPKGEA